MASLLWNTCFAFLVVETFTGMVANGFIVLINCTDWFRQRKLSTTDLILTCLGLSRLMWQTTVIVDAFMFHFFPHNYSYLLKHEHLMNISIWNFLNNVNLWLAAWLSVLYLVKIATFSHPVFLQVKLRFSGMVPWLLLSSVVLSTFLAIIITGLMSASDNCDSSELQSNRSCDPKIDLPCSSNQCAIGALAPMLIPSVIFLSSMILLIISLWKHTRRLKCNGIGVRDPSTIVHLNAIKALTSFAVLYLFCLVAITVQLVLFWINKGQSGKFMIFNNVTALYPSVHGVILILINPKLKQAWVRMIQRLKCSLKETPS